MNNLRDFYGTKAWSLYYQTPTFPFTHNAWIYLAYALACTDSVEPEEVSRISKLLAAHLGKPIKRVSTDIDPSHDELIGYMYVSRYFGFTGLSESVYQYMQNTGFRMGEETRNQYEFRGEDRFISVRAIMSAMTNRKCALTDELLYCAWVIAGAFSFDGGSGPYLKRWITFECMSKQKFAPLAISIFKLSMAIRKKSLPKDLALESGVSEFEKYAEGLRY
jgi:hypothetical protein